MKASVLTKYGPPEVLQIRDIDKPRPGERDVLIRVLAAPVSFGDTLVRDFASVTPAQFNMPGLFWLIGKLSFGVRRPRVAVLGSEFAGVVDAVGRRVTRFKPGDPVFGFRGPRMGAYAEYLCMPEKGLIEAQPGNLTAEQASAGPYGALMALGLLKKLRLEPGRRVLVVGASGGIGPALVQVARRYFEAEVAGVCGAARLDYVKSLGADMVIDYKQENFLARPETYDVIIDILGKTPFSRARRILEPRGRLVFVSFKSRQILQMLGTALFGGRKVLCPLIAEKPENLALARELMEAGRLRPIVDRVFPLEQAAEAHRYAESGARKGAVVISLATAEARS